MKRSILLIGSVAAVLISSKFLLENLLGVNLEPLVEAWIVHAGLGTAAIVVALLAADVFLPIPSSVVMVLSGAAFGVLWGTVISLVGSIGGEWLGFELARRFGRRASANLIGDDEADRLNRLFARHGAMAVVVTRGLPLVMETMSFAAGLSVMTRGTFIMMSFLGTAPIAWIYAYAGVVSRQVGTVVPAVAMIVAVAALGWVIYRTRIADD